jgi:hypothetical protein
MLRQILDAAQDMFLDGGSYPLLISAFERPDELRVLADRFLVWPAGLGSIRE